MIIGDKEADFPHTVVFSYFAGNSSSRREYAQSWRIGSADDEAHRAEKSDPTERVPKDGSMRKDHFFVPRTTPNDGAVKVGEMSTQSKNIAAPGFYGRIT